jgi:HSP20 family protein
MAEEKKESTKGAENVPVKRSASPFEEMERMFENMMSRQWMRPLRWEWPSWPELPKAFEGRFPKVDIVDRDEEIVVRAEVPGVKKEDLEVSTTDNTVTIKGSTSHEEKEEKGDYFRSEITRGTFTRTLALPGDVDGAKAQASFTDGVLELKLPKVAKSKRHTVKLD